MSLTAVYIIKNINERISNVKKLLSLTDDSNLNKSPFNLIDEIDREDVREFINSNNITIIHKGNLMTHYKSEKGIREHKYYVVKKLKAILNVLELNLVQVKKQGHLTFIEKMPLIFKDCKNEMACKYAYKLNILPIENSFVFNVGKNIQLANCYVIRVDDDDVLDISFDYDEDLYDVSNQGDIIRGFNQAMTTFEFESFVNALSTFCMGDVNKEHKLEFPSLNLSGYYLQCSRR